MKLLPDHLKEKLQNKPYLSKIINNIGWLFFDKILRMGVGLFIGAWIARYLGPEQLGLLNYALAIISFLVVFASFGLNNIVVRDLVNEPQKSNEILGSTFLIQAISALLSFSFLLILTFSLFSDSNSKLVIIIVGFTLLFKPIDTIRYYFEANIQSKYIVWAENSSFIICSFIKVIMILTQASFIAIVSVFLLDGLIISILILTVYFYKKQSIFSWTANFQRIKHSIKASWPLILSGLTIMIYMRTDQIILGYMQGYESVGIYTAASKISEIWYFIPMIIMSSINPILIELKSHNKDSYYNKLKNITSYLVVISIIIAILTTFLSPYIIHILYGAQYQQAANILTIHIWTGVFVSMGVATSNWYIIENLQILSFYRTLFGAIVNVLLCFLLIPNYGVLGAAFATLFAQICASFLYDIFNTKTRKLFLLKLQSLNIMETFKNLIQCKERC